MGTRQQLHNELKELADHVYYQAPSAEKMVYPCIRYSITSGKAYYADNKTYKYQNCYIVTYIAIRPTDSIIEDMTAKFQYCRFDRYYVADDLHHYTFVLFY